MLNFFLIPRVYYHSTTIFDIFYLVPFNIDSAILWVALAFSPYNRVSDELWGVPLSH